jgi:hypothetical protein
MDALGLLYVTAAFAVHGIQSHHHYFGILIEVSFEQRSPV